MFNWQPENDVDCCRAQVPRPHVSSFWPLFLDPETRGSLKCTSFAMSPANPSRHRLRADSYFTPCPACLLVYIPRRPLVRPLLTNRYFLCDTGDFHQLVLCSTTPLGLQLLVSQKRFIKQMQPLSWHSSVRHIRSRICATNGLRKIWLARSRYCEDRTLPRTL